MKSDKFIVTLLLVMWSVSCWTTYVGASEAEITDRKGVTTKVTNIKLYLSDTCQSNMILYAGVPTETTVNWDVFPVFTGNYLVKIPFAIIQEIKAKGVIYQVTLGDGTSITGKFWPPFSPRAFLIGDSDLGTFQLYMDDETNVLGSFSSIVFDRKPEATFNAHPTGGSHSGTLKLADNSQLQLTGLRLVTEGKNKNGCFTGEEYPSMLKFQTGESVYDLAWSKIAEIKWLGDALKGIELVTPSGSKYVGDFSLIGGTSGVQGIGTISENYKLEVTVTIRSKATLIVEKSK